MVVNSLQDVVQLYLFTKLCMPWDDGMNSHDQTEIIMLGLSLKIYVSHAYTCTHPNMTAQNSLLGAIGQRNCLTMYDALHINIRYCPGM